ncbi:Negative regulator of mitotic exit [Mortierella sp. AM989]|nr:Negative regulator of mitotic exit [Mortierella sp. AM989]
MAGLFSKKNKKEKEEKAAAAKAAAAAAAAANSNTNNLTSNASSASASAPANGGPNTSNASFTSSTSNLPTSKQGTGPPGAGQGQGQHPRDNSSANNSLTNSINNPMSSTAVSTTSASDYASQHQQQQQQLGTHGPSSKSSFDSDKTRMYQLQQYQQQQHQHHQQLSLNGPWTSSLVLSLNPFPRFSHTASYVHTGTDIYVFGGITKATTQKDMHVIDFPSLQCQVLQTIGADNPPPTAGHTAVTLGQYIMYFGGRDTKNKCSESLYVLHTVRKEWNRPVIHGLLPAPRHSHAACVIGTTMFIFGGQFNGYYLNDIASFDMKSLNTPSPKWSRLEPTSELPPARAGHCAAAYDGKVYIFGGADDNFFYNDIWCYDPQANNWEAVPAFGVLPTSRQGHACSVVEDTMYIYGGMNHEDQFLGDLSAFKFNGEFKNNRRWLTFPDTPESPSPRTEHAMCAVGDKVYILGGQLELNAEDDAGAVYILDTTKIRYHEPSIATQRSNYDNDSTLQTEGGADDSNSSIRRHTPSPDSTRQHPLSDANYDPRKAFQQQLHGGSLDHIVGASSNSHSHRFSDDTNIGAHLQPRLSLDGTDGSPSRRRPLGKPTHYTIHEVEPRATQSVDETRRPSLLDSNDYYEQSRGQRPQQFTNGVSFSAGQQQQHESNRRRSLDSRNRGSHNQTSAHQPRASLDQSRSVGNAATVQQQLQQQHHYDLSDSQYYNNKEAELKDLRQREQWLLAEVAVSRKKMGERPMSLTVALKEDMGAFNMDRDSDKYKIMQALLSVKAELERSKTSIVTQAQIASNKLREAERVRTAALQEAAYLKAKVSALQSGEASSLASTEVARAVDLEKRLTLALGQIEKLQTQTYQHDTILERERHAREVAVERERQTTTRAEEAELSHTRSLAELATLHERASKAEASLRECEAKNATNEAGLSSFQQQSTALFSQISALKTTVDHQKKSLEKAKLAYSVANDRAEHADRLWTQARQEIDTTQLESAGLRADLDQDMNESTYTSGSNSRKHDSIMAITSASRVAELEHELGTLRHLLRESQAAAAQANKDLGDAMVRTSQLEQSSMVARAEAAKAQRQLTASEDKLSSLETQLARKDESLEEMAKEQENNEVQLGVLRGVMRENGLLADDIILDALSLGEDGKPVGATNLAGLKTKAQELEKRAQEAESQLEQLETLKKQHEDRIQQLEADYQTAVHYVQGSETMLQRIRDEAQAAKTERDATLAKFTELEIAHAQCSEIRNSAGEAAAASAAAAAASVQLEGEVSDLHRQLHEAVGRSMELEQKMEELSRTLQESEIASESTQSELKTLKSKHHEHKKQALTASQSYQAKLEQLEASIEEAQASLAETQHQLESNQYELEQAHELNKSTSKELEEALAALKAVSESAATQKDSDSAIALEAEQKRAATFAAHHEDLQLVIDNAQKTIQELQVRNQDLEQQLRASENKISILLDNFQGPESVRNSVASSGGGDDLIMRLLEANHQGLLAGRSSHLAPSSHGDRSSADSLANELELLRSNWAQTHLNGTAYKQGSLTPLVASTVAATNEKASEDVDYAATTPTAENSAHDVKEVSTSEVAGEVAAVEESGPPSSISSSATAIPSSPSSSSMSNMTSAQKLEEYERMIDDMTNTRRTLEE